jgi:hypothetical protein
MAAPKVQLNLTAFRQRRRLLRFQCHQRRRQLQQDIQMCHLLAHSKKSYQLF